MKIAYYSFGGRYSDNPRALHQRLLARGDVDAEHVWLAGPQHAGSFPAGTATAPLGTPEALAALEAADLVVADNHLPAWDKRPGTTYLQTWHGTPLKRIHRDARSTQPEGEDVMSRLDDDITRWDVLLAPSEAAAVPLRAAFRFTGPVPVTGYPRNDALLVPDVARRRQRVRAALGVPEDRTAVLYAPTWRDDDRFGDGPDFRLRLDLERFAQRLGGSHVLLLRLHYLVPDALRGLHVPGVVDVSHHPDINDLYLAADVLVTDYSSAMFDFAITGKPIVSFTYDFEHYRDVLRGFYFDLHGIAPGPVLARSEEVLDAVEDPEELRVASKERYELFQETFCHAEDGRAADRVLDLVLNHPEVRP
ncbi:CDP-glycerol glycerophosphotransferase family protein [Kineococcus sp. TRM81007]|uniref:CDP-glycerol glycerophosphotransferase family protein n=1 Tax=Kineococcus sp. TRM81007 TaxID=2925831 RepID=UPI001F5615C0|nr:CDP-glycerol glycerophosphotransferase family protein [Kineococcus sp. TRM81007]MCI2238225.1 CDP-glycerol glycerophosphotransferase family protein [Kineococcus sp. TRM81007]